MFRKVLIANRGEIALRVMWACKELGIKTVAVYSEADAGSLHVRFADQAVCIGPPRNVDSYLNIPAIISAAEITGADAIHPGYGFLSESPYLAEICEACNIKFIGPGPQAIRLMGDKSRAKKTMARAGVPVIPGSPGVVEDEEKSVKVAREVGYPIILKASAGGGGRGMRIVRNAAELAPAFRAAQAEAAAAFGVPDVYIEKYVEAPRHIEIQIMADTKGNVVHLGERECSIQRRHQKLIEEAPSTVVGERLRRRMGQTAVDAAEAVEYTNAGAIECRINAEDPVTFAPSPGLIRHVNLPGGPGVRVDTFIHDGCEVVPYYDSLIAKLMVHGQNRAEAVARMRRCLDVLVVEGIKTNAALHRRIIDDPDFQAGRIDTRFLERFQPPKKVAAAG